jgi:hypothetical protein
MGTWRKVPGKAFGRDPNTHGRAFKYRLSENYSFAGLTIIDSRDKS